MGYYLTHLELSMVAILLIGLFGKQFEPGPIPDAMVVCGAVYICLHEIGRLLYRVWRKHHRTWGYKYIEEKATEERPCYLFDLKAEEDIYGRN